MQVDDFYSTRPGFECDYKHGGGNSWAVHPWMETAVVSGGTLLRGAIRAVGIIYERARRSGMV